MRVLAIDCATSACSAAVLHGEDIVGHRFAEMERGHAEALVPMISDVLNEAGTGVSDMDLLAVTIGPGAFTGVRIGLSTMQAMALASDLPLGGVTTLEAVAARQPDRSAALLVALETKRSDIYVQLFAPDGTELTGPMALAPEALHRALPEAPVIVAGDAAPRAIEALRQVGVSTRPSGGPGLPDAREVAEIAACRAVLGRSRRAAPLYLRPPDVGPKRRTAP